MNSKSSLGSPSPKESLFRSRRDIFFCFSFIFFSAGSCGSIFAVLPSTPVEYPIALLETTMNIDPATDLLQLLREAEGANPEALNQLLSLLRPVLRANVTRLLPASVRAKHGSSDLVQEALWVACGSLPRFRGSTEAELLGWLQGIAKKLRHRTFKFYSRDKRNVRREEVLPEEIPVVSRGNTPIEAAIAEETRLASERALLLLPEEMRWVIALRQDRLPYDEIAARINRTEDAARKLHARALIRWKALIEQGEK
jgi:RNA polymerase sigma-70 factor, ECF subfamily